MHWTFCDFSGFPWFQELVGTLKFRQCHRNISICLGATLNSLPPAKLFMLFCCLLIFFKIIFSKNYFRNTIWVSSKDPDQARHFVGPDMRPNCLQKLSRADTGRKWVLSGLIWVQSVCKSYQQMTLADKRVKMEMNWSNQLVWEILFWQLKWINYCYNTVNNWVKIKHTYNNRTILEHIITILTPSYILFGTKSVFLK